MAFIFPDPSEQQAVTNPTTGVNYVWKEDLGKWVVASQTSALSEAIWEGTNPPPADQQDNYQLWYNTDTLELYFLYCDENAVCAWVPTSKPISALDDLTAEVSAAGADIAVVKLNLVEVENDVFGIKENLQDIQDGLGQVTLEEVLNNGNVADKGFVLTNAEDDALLVSPEEARIMVGGKGEDVVPRLELRHTTGVLETSIVKLELDEDGDRFDIECDEKVNNIHFRFNDEAKLDLNKTGDAVFNGRVKVAEAVQSDEVPTLGQVTAVTDLLQLELDQITGSYERGAWNHDDGDGITDGTEYVLTGVQTQESFDKAKAPLDEAYSQCLEEAGEDQSQAAVCNREYTSAISRIPEVGTTYNTNDWKIVNKVRFSPYDLDGNNHSFKDVEPGQTLDMYCDDGSGFMVARIDKVTPGFWYEEKTLEVTPLKTSGIANGKTRVKIFTLDDSVDSDALDSYVKKSGENKVSSGWKIASTNKTHFHVDGDQTKIYWLADPKHEQHPVTLSYLQTYVAEQIAEINAKQITPAPFTWIYKKTSSDPGDGEMTSSKEKPAKGDVIKLSHKTSNNIQLSRRRSTIYFEALSDQPLLTIWDLVSSGYRHKISASVSKIEQDGEGNVVITLGSTNGSDNHNLTIGETQWVTIGGFF